MESEVKKEESFPLVSVIVPCYNHENYIIECLNSIYNSSYKNIELILIDDGSKDESYEVANKWLSKKQKRFTNINIDKQDNVGICKTLNRLINKAKGEFIFPLASDDMIPVNGIRDSVNQLLLTSKDILLTDVSLIDENSKLISKSASAFYRRPTCFYKNKYILYSDIILNWNPPFQFYCAKKSYYEKYGYYDETISFEDYDFILKAIKNDNFTYSNLISREYRIRLNNRITPGLEIETINKELISIQYSFLFKFSGYKKFLIRLLLMQNLEQKSLLGFIKKYYSKISLKVIRQSLFILYKLSRNKYAD